jgi:DNA-binding transcriptional LysR family regulator
MAALGPRAHFRFNADGFPRYRGSGRIGAAEAPFRNVTQMPTPESVIELVRAGMGVGVFSLGHPARTD